MELFEFIRVTREIKNTLKPISLHDSVLSKCATILIYYPMKESKLKIYLSLDEKKRVGMLTRYILGVASKIGVYQTIIKEIIDLKQDYKKYIKYAKQDTMDNFWKKRLEINQRELNKQFTMLLDIIIEEIDRRNDPKYLRKKKLNLINQNLQN